MRGMRVGGRRELIVPDHLGYEDGTGSLIYVIELVSVELASGSSTARRPRTSSCLQPACAIIPGVPTRKIFAERFSAQGLAGPPPAIRLPSPSGCSPCRARTRAARGWPCGPAARV